ncbi:penicillin-binding transpeptidase domain-containing protein [Actinomadura scrupuli]|uniref:penicillin-binding transpeptidase domain-containing protein n=1 Tax=Actinomadura scrupuli TaxID=559629 RepID=UPI003D9730E2
MTKARKAGAALVCGMLVSTLGACGFAEPSPFGTVQDFLIAWQVQNYTAAAKHTTGDRAAVAEALRAVPQQLDAASVKLSINNSKIVESGDGYDAQFQVKIDLGENGDPWTYPSQMHLRRSGTGWKIVWTPSIIHPLLENGQRLAVVTETPKRAPVQDYQGKPLLKAVRTDIVGVIPRSLRDPKATLDALALITNLDPDRLIGRVNSAPPQEFLPLATLEQIPANRSIIAKAGQIPGLVVRSQIQQIAPSMAAEFVGTLGPATAVKLQQVGAPYQPGDTIGDSGLQLLYQRQLASTPTVKVVAENPQDGKEPTVLTTWPSKDVPQPLRTTLEPKTQVRAEQALRSVRGPASMVAVKPSTGEVLAVANSGTGGRNLALEGQYPPGMTFGLVSAEALFQRGLQPSQMLPCPATVTVGGQVINTASSRPGNATFDRNFARSCTTTLAPLGSSLDAATLAREASRFGLGLDWGLTVPVFTGSVRPPVNEGEKALTMIGQGKVLTSPLAMALVAGAVDSGTWRPPQLLNNVVQSALQPQQQTPLAQPQVLPGGVVKSLQLLMRRSVAYGTGQKANVPGQSRVNGVAASVDYGQGRTVSWFVGYRGDVAFAIAVESKVDAATVAAKFLNAATVNQTTPGTKPPASATAGTNRPAGRTTPFVPH